MRFVIGWLLVCTLHAGMDEQHGATASGGQPLQTLPRSEDVLPAREVSRGSLVVTGDGYRFQVPPQLLHVDHPRSKLAYRGTVKGLLDPAELTVYATREPFEGDLAALVRREIARVQSRGGKISTNTPAQIHIDGKMSPAHRFFASGDVLGLYVLAVHQGHAYIFHADTPNTPTAFPNMGSDMMICGSTFHVSPPQ